jgi:hypothetical protein
VLNVIFGMMSIRHKKVSFLNFMILKALGPNLGGFRRCGKQQAAACTDIQTMHRIKFLAIGLLNVFNPTPTRIVRSVCGHARCFIDAQKVPMILKVVVEFHTFLIAGFRKQVTILIDVRG